MIVWGGKWFYFSYYFLVQEEKNYEYNINHDNEFKTPFNVFLMYKF
jgi:hypothetical protein